MKGLVTKEQAVKPIMYLAITSYEGGSDPLVLPRESQGHSS